MKLSKFEGVAAIIGLLSVFVTIIVFFTNLNSNVSTLMKDRDKQEKQIKELKVDLIKKIKEFEIKKKELMKLQEFLEEKFDFKKKIDSSYLFDQAVIEYTVEFNKQKNNSYYSIIEKFKNVLHYQPENDQAYFYLAKSYRLNGDINSAFKAISKAISINNMESKYFYEKGVQYEEIKRYSNAIIFYNKAKNTKNSDNRVYTRLVHCYKALGKYKLALEYASQYIKLTDSSPRSLYIRGLTYYQYKKYKKAIKDFEEIIRLEKISGSTIGYTKPVKKLIINSRNKINE